jgi:hypothetical protein
VFLRCFRGVSGVSPVCFRCVKLPTDRDIPQLDFLAWADVGGSGCRGFAEPESHAHTCGVSGRFRDAPTRDFFAPIGWWGLRGQRFCRSRKPGTHMQGYTPTFGAPQECPPERLAPAPVPTFPSRSRDVYPESLSIKPSPDSRVWLTSLWGSVGDRQNSDPGAPTTSTQATFRFRGSAKLCTRSPPHIAGTTRQPARASASHELDPTPELTLIGGKVEWLHAATCTGTLATLGARAHNYGHRAPDVPT